MPVDVDVREPPTPAIATVRRRARLEAATIASGVALALLVGRDGSPGWQALRVLAVAALTSLLVAVELHASQRWRGRLSVLIGIVAIAVAVGFAPCVAKGGSTAVQLATFLLGTTGVVLVIAGTATATRGHRPLRRLGTCVAVLVVSVLVVFVVSPAVAATNVPRPGIGATPDTFGLEYANVSLRTPDDVTLAGWYVPSENGAAVVLLHGAGSTRSTVLPQAAVLARHGFGVLMIDARGHGDSGGRGMDFGWHGDADIAGATTYLASRPDVSADRIGIVGLSMGGEEALGASGSNELIRAVVAEGATARNADDEAWLSDRYGVRGLLQEQLERVQDWATDVLTSASVPTSMRAAVTASGDTRYLLITGGKVATERHAAEYVATAAPDRVEVWTVDGAGHTAGLRTAPEEWEARVTRFLTDALLSDRSPGT